MILNADHVRQRSKKKALHRERLLFCHFAQPENGIFGIFILFVKIEYRLFMPALRRLDTAAGACAKALPPFCAYMVAAHTAVRYNKAVPKENTKKQENIGRKCIPAFIGGKGL